MRHIVELPGQGGRCRTVDVRAGPSGGQLRRAAWICASWHAPPSGARSGRTERSIARARSPERLRPRREPHRQHPASTSCPAEAAAVGVRPAMRPAPCPRRLTTIGPSCDPDLVSDSVHTTVSIDLVDRGRLRQRDQHHPAALRRRSAARALPRAWVPHRPAPHRSRAGQLADGEERDRVARPPARRPRPGPTARDRSNCFDLAQDTTTSSIPGAAVPTTSITPVVASRFAIRA